MSAFVKVLQSHLICFLLKHICFSWMIWRSSSKTAKKKKWAFCVIAGKENSGFEKYGQEKSLLFQGMLRVIPWIMGNNSISMHKFRFKPLFQSGIKMLSSQSWLLYVYRSKQKQHGTIVTLASNLILLSAVELSIGRCTPRVVTIS